MLTIRQIIAQSIARNTLGTQTSEIYNAMLAHRPGVKRDRMHTILREMRAAEELIAVGAQQARRYYANAITHQIAESEEYFEPADPAECEEKPFVHNLVPYGQWAVNGSVAHGARWVFDLGGRA